MWAIIEDNTITKIINKPRGLIIGDTRHSRKIFSLWSVAEKEAKGIYEVVFDNTNKKDEAYYNNTNQSFAFADGVVTASYGSATANALADRNATDGDGVELDPVVIIKGLKTKHKEIIKQQASNLLTPTDWYVIKATDVASYSVPSVVTTFRTNVRAKSNTIETAIDNASDVDALAALYKYVNTGTKKNPVMKRPLGEFPTLEV
jgi:hypothetical protein